MKKKIIRYIANVLIYSRYYDKHYQPGEVFNWDEIPEDAENKPDMERLLSLGAISVYTDPWPIPEEGEEGEPAAQIVEPTPEEVENG